MNKTPYSSVEYGDSSLNRELVDDVVWKLGIFVTDIRLSATYNI